MRSTKFMMLLGLVCLACFGAVWLWQARGLVSGPITPAQLDAYLAKVDAANLPAEEKSGLKARLRAWGEADDGQPFFMLNLMRYHRELRRWPGAPAFEGTPRQSNAWYESHVLPIALGLGAYPVAGGEAQGGDVLLVGGKSGGHDPHAVEPELDGWDRVLLMRYPSRRAFFDLVTDPRYLPYMPYKLMALQVVLVPVTAEAQVPDLRWVAGSGLFALFLGIGWWRSFSSACAVSRDGRSRSQSRS